MASGSLAKASTPEPFSASRTSNWVARAGGLPPYVQHVAHDLQEEGRAADESGAIKEAIGIVKHPPHNWGPEARAAAAEAAAQWEAMKARSGGIKGHVGSGLGSSLRHLTSTVRTADGRGRK